MSKYTITLSVELDLDQTAKVGKTSYLGYDPKSFALESVEPALPANIEADIGSKAKGMHFITFKVLPEAKVKEPKMADMDANGVIKMLQEAGYTVSKAGPEPKAETVKVAEPEPKAETVAFDPKVFAEALAKTMAGLSK